MKIITQLKRNFKNFMFLEFNEKWPSFKQKNLKEIKSQWPEQSEEQKQLEQKLKDIEWSLKFLSWYWKSLDKWTKKLKQNIEDNEDKIEIKNLQDKLQRLKLEYKTFLSDWKLIKQELDTLKNWVEELQKWVDKVEFETGKEYNSKTKEITNNSFSVDKLKTITNSEFLQISSEKRLQYITKNHIDSQSISDWVVNDLEFTFTFDWNFNKELYLKTTAGQVLPNEVREVESNWIIYTRKWLKWEFFANWWRRLIIEEWTKINNIKIWTKEEIKKLESELEKKVSNFIETNPWTEKYQDLLLEASKRNIDLKFSILAFWEKILETKNIFERWVLIEEMFTEYDRKKWEINSIEKNKEEWVEVLMLRQFWWKEWKTKAEKLWISSGIVKQYEYSNLCSIDINDLPKWVKWLLWFIANTENNWLNYEAIFAREKSSQAFNKPLSNMTVSEVISNQINYKRQHWYRSAAIWAYQFMDYTLKDMIKNWVISPNEKFTPEFQDKIALIKLKQRWLNSFLSWATSKEQFAHNLSQEWASLPDPYNWGKSFYSWDWLNNSLTSWSNFSKVLDNTIV